MRYDDGDAERGAGLVLGAGLAYALTATITIVYSLMVSILVVLPAMVVWGAYQNMRLRSIVERTWNDLDVAIEAVHRRHEEGRDAS